MNNMDFGLQLYSVREALSRDEWGTLKKVAEIGYRQVELCAPDFENGRPAPSCPPEEMRARYRDLGFSMPSIAMAVNFHTELDDWKRLAEYSAAIGCAGICCSVATFEHRDEVLRLADFFNAVGAFAARHGQRFYYHNHYHEFQKFGGETVLDTLVARTDAACVDFELDTFWALRGGVDPIALMDRLGDRLKLVHQKDLSAETRPVNLFERIAEGEVLDWDGFIRYAHDPAAFAELGRGVMDVDAILEKARSMPSVESVIIEQDATAIGEFESAKVNFDYMKKRLHGEGRA